MQINISLEVPKYFKRVWQAITNTTKRKYEGADHGKRTSGFPVNNLSPNKDIGASATILRQRAKYLYQNTVYAKRAINGIANGMVGTGIQATILCSNTRQKDNITALWNQFALSLMCDFNGRLNFYGLQKLVGKTFMRDGECLVLRRRVPVSQSNCGIQIQVLEMEFLADYINYQVLPSGGYTQHGIEYNKYGKVVGYWLFNRHPSEWYSQPELYPAADVAHVFIVDYPGQGRGVPQGAQTIIVERDLNDYEDAELVAKKVQASHALFRTTNTLEDGEEPNPDDYDSDEELEKIEPGTIYKLLPGESITAATPPTSTGTEDYRRSKQRNLSAGYEVTYEMMTNDYSQVNFTSGRMGWIEHQRSLDSWQWLTLIPGFNDRVWAWFVDQLPLTPGFIGTTVPKDLSVTWSVPKREMLDPVKETNAMTKLAAGRFKSWSEIVKSMGDDPAKVLAQMKEDQAKFKEAGLTSDWLMKMDIDILTQLAQAGTVPKTKKD